MRLPVNGWGSEITISDETSEVLETGGGVLFAADYFKNDASWLVMNADILTTMPLDKMMAADAGIPMHPGAAKYFKEVGAM